MKAKRIYFVSALSLFAIFTSATTTLGSEGGGEQSTLFTGDLGNIVWTLITFFVVLGVLGKFAWGPILSALQKREDFIRDSLTQAKRDREDAGQQLKEYTEKLVAARAEATAIVDEGRRDAEVLKRKIEDDAKVEAQASLDRAKREIALATDTAVKELYTIGAKLATEVAGKIIRKELNAGDHERLISESIDDLEKVGRS
ncbi:MAG: F0F1 ATP synthase subunit B [Planctomycetes bacterium]|nr:F0F1 ATP synthase subunit B [Planctomycetota bacterium]MCH7632293.1 F0F1 ATP synthase subunit B [Planctomycetota bacterium]